MARYLVGRLLQFVPVVFGVTFLVYGLVFAIPGDPIQALGGERGIAPTVAAELEERYNLNDPFLVRYAKYIGVVPDEKRGFDGLLQGNLGTTFTRRPVADMLTSALPVTARLTATAFAIEIVLGMLAGVLAALRRGSYLDNLVLVSTVALISVPSLVTAFLAQLLFGVELRWLPVSGQVHGWVSYLMPGVVLASTSMAYIARLARTSMIENLRADWAAVAVSKGISRRRLMSVHVLRNSLIPVVTFLAADLGSLMGGTVVIETIFNLNGVGLLVFRSIFNQDGTAVVGAVTFLVLVYLAANLVVDVLYAMLDPRIRPD